MSSSARKTSLIISFLLIALVLLFSFIYFYRASLVTGSFVTVENITVNRLLYTASGDQLQSFDLGRSQISEQLFQELKSAKAQRKIGDDHTFLHDNAFSVVITYADGRIETVLPTENQQYLYRIIVSPHQQNDYKLVYSISDNQQLIAEILALTAELMGE
jgi:hypothetical protein